MTDDSKERKWADTQFKKSERATEGAQAMAEYIADRNAERAKTARLRALRLAKEAADKVVNQPRQRRAMEHKLTGYPSSC